MRTRTCVIVLLIVALAGSVAIAMQAAQDNSAKPQPPAQRTLSETRSASCLVRITVDPAIVPLDPTTTQSLLYSSGVAARAARETLHLVDSGDNPWETLIEMEWLNESSPQSSATTTSAKEEAAAYDRQMLQEMENIYGQEYMRQMARIDSKTRDKQNQPPGGSADRTGRYGPRSRENPRAPLSPARSAPGAAHSATIRLSVHLPDGALPAADEFLAAVVENLKEALRHAYEDYTTALNGQLEEARHQHDSAIDALQGGTDPETSAIRERLNTTVDLSVLDPDMPVGEAIDMLRKSVDPPLNIVVLWNDLTAFLSVERTTPVNLDGMPSVRLGTALDLLVRGLPASEEQATWRIQGGAIVIATAATLGESGELTGQPNVETDVRTLAAQRAGLANQLQDLELTVAGQEARRKAIAEQIARAQGETQDKLAKDEVTRELESLVRFAMENFSSLRQQAEAKLVSTADVDRANENLTRARIELAKRREELSKQAGGGQLEQLNSEMSRIAIDRAEKEAQRGILSRQIAQIQQQLAQASTFDPEAARVRMAKEGLDILARRIAELQAQIANLQPPMVTMIGAN